MYKLSGIFVAWMLFIAVAAGNAVKRYDAAALAKTWKTFGQSEVFRHPDAVEIAFGAYPHHYGGLKSPRLALDAGTVKQIELTMAADQPGFVKLAFYFTADGKERLSSLDATLVPDGQWRTVRFPVASDPAWQGTIDRLEIIYHQVETGRVRFRCLRLLERENLLPAAESIRPGELFDVDLIRPRGRYTLSWEGGSHAGLTLECLGRDLKTLRTVTLPAGQPSVSFQAPELTMTGQLRLAAAAAGYPRLALDALRPLHEQPAAWRGVWIGPVAKSDGPVWFRREFELPANLQEGSLTIAADSVFELYVNGRQVRSWKHARHAIKYNLTGYFRPGRNTVEVKVTGRAPKDVLICDFYGRGADGAELFRASDADWTCAAGGDTLPEVIAAPVEVRGAAAAIPVEYLYCGPAGRVEILDAEPGRLRFRVLEKPAFELEEITCRLEGASGKSLAIRLPVAWSAAEWQPGATVEGSYPTPHFLGEEAKIFLNDQYLTAVSRRPLGVAPAVPAASPGRLAETKIGEVGGRPAIVSNGTPYLPIIWGGTGSFQGKPLERGYLIRDGLETETPLLIFSLAVPSFWLGPDKFDFSRFDRFMERIAGLNPEFKILMLLYCMAPDWWMKANPDDLTAFYTPRKRGNFDRQALGSKKWLADAAVALRAMVDHIGKSWYADRILGATVAESWNSEWFWETDMIGNNRRGYSPADLATFRAYLREKYGSDAALAAAWRQPGLTFDAVKMPTPAEQKFPGRIGALLDPAQDAKLMDWYGFRNRSVGEAVIELCRVLKEATGGKWLAGAYYGYFIEFAGSDWRTVQEGGHNHFLEVAKSPHVDFVRAPLNYQLRRTGAGAGIMQSEHTYILRRKLLLLEQDSRSFAGQFEVRFGSSSSVYETVGALHRGFGMMLAQGGAQYWLDFGRWYEEKVLLETIRDQNRALAALPPVAGTTPREVTLVHDGPSACYTKINNAADGIYFGAVDNLMKRFSRVGVSYRNLTVADLLEDGLAPPGKFYLVTTALALSKEQREQLMARFEREKATVLWMYAPGFYYPGESPKADNVGDFLGLRCAMETAPACPEMRLEAGWGLQFCRNPNRTAPFFYPVAGYDEVIGRRAGDGKPMLVRKVIGGATHYFATQLALPNELIRAIAARAGVHLYHDGGDPLWAGNDVVFLHARTGGDKSISLPPGTRMRAIIGPVEGVYASGAPWPAKAGLTYGFLVEKE